MVGSLITRLIPFTVNKAILRQKGYSTDHIASSQGFPQGNMRKDRGGLGTRLRHKLLIRQFLCCGVPHPPTIKVIATPLYIAWEEQQTWGCSYVLCSPDYRPPRCTRTKGSEGIQRRSWYVCWYGYDSRFMYVYTSLRVHANMYSYVLAMDLQAGSLCTYLHTHAQ